MKRKTIKAAGSIAFLLLFATLFTTSAYAQYKVTPDEAKKIAKEALIFNYPLVMYYRTMYLQAIDTKSKSYSGGFGKWLHLPTSSPKGTDIVSPNNDSPYSYAWVDLRTDPWVVTLPKIEAKRFYTSQWDDLWDFVFDNPGSVEDGNDGVSVLLASPTWNGKLPKGVNRVIHGDSEFLGTLTRTQLIEPKDLPSVQKIQKEYKLPSAGWSIIQSTVMQKANDASITIYFQAKSPGKDKESNWLPAPEGPFWPILRTYGPGKPILNGSWKLPQVKQVK